MGADFNVGKTYGTSMHDEPKYETHSSQRGRELSKKNRQNFVIFTDG